MIFRPREARRRTAIPQKEEQRSGGGKASGNYQNICDSGHRSNQPRQQASEIASKIANTKLRVCDEIS